MALNPLNSSNLEQLALKGLKLCSYVSFEIHVILASVIYLMIK